ncbi:MAG: hypothetical protein V4660_02370 [Pseudomonadota bacterium]
MNNPVTKKTLIFLALGLLNACVHTTVENIENATHQGYCSDDHILPLAADECEEKMLRELHGKPEKSESEKIMDRVNQTMNEKKQMNR